MLAGTLALMTGYSQFLQASVNPAHRVCMGEKITRQLAYLAEHDSLSVQHTLYAMGEAVLETVDVEEIHIAMPNLHHLPVDLTPFGLENRNEIFVATREPYGLIEGTVRRR